MTDIKAKGIGGIYNKEPLTIFKILSMWWYASRAYKAKIEKHSAEK